MNYERIYNELIEHRKMLPRLEGVYYEKHHIKPKNEGGSDKAENIIYLTASDHFMAHLLYAKAFGGKHWHSVHIMSTQYKEKRKLGYRKIFSLIRKNKAIANSLSRTVYEMIDIDRKEIIRGTAAEISERYGFKEQSIRSVLRQTRVRCKNLCCVTPRNINMFLKQFTFKNINTQVEADMTIHELYNLLPNGISYNSLQSLINGTIIEIKGWRLIGNIDSTFSIETKKENNKWQLGG